MVNKHDDGCRQSLLLEIIWLYWNKYPMKIGEHFFFVNFVLSIENTLWVNTTFVQQIRVPMYIDDCTIQALFRLSVDIGKVLMSTDYPVLLALSKNLNSVRAEILTIFRSYFGRNDDFGNSFWNLLTFRTWCTVIFLRPSFYHK